MDREEWLRQTGFGQYPTDQQIIDAHRKNAAAQPSDYKRGIAEGIRRYAWWKDGVQYVGSCGTTLKDALEALAKEA